MPPRRQLDRFACDHEGVSSLVRLAALLGVVLTAAACAEVGQPYVGATPTTELAGEELPVAEEAPVEATATDETVPAAEEFQAPQAPADYLPDLLVAAEAVWLGPLQSWKELDGVIGTTAVDDLFGGLVTQDANGTVRWYRPGQPEPDIVPTPPGNLVGVIAVSASPAAIVADGQDISLANLLGPEGTLGGEATTVATLAEGDELLGYSSRAGLQALALSDEQCGSVRLQRLDGDVLAAGPAVPECPVPRRPEVTDVALGPDGTQLAFTQISYRDDGVVAETEVVVLELASGVETFRSPLAGPSESVNGLAFDGSRVAVSVSGPERSVVVLANIAGGDPVVRDLESVTSVRFARLPVTVDVPSQ